MIIRICFLPLLILFSGNSVFSQPNNTRILIADTGERPVIQFDSLENIHFLWYDAGIYHAIYDTVAAQILSPHEISSYNSQYTDLALGENIGFSVWEAFDGGTMRTHIWGQMFAINGDTIGENFIINYPQYQDLYRYDANITHTQNDSFFVVWSCDDGGIYGQLLTDSTIAYDNFLINDHPILSNYFLPQPKLGSYAGCPFIVVIWIDDRDGTPLLYGRTFSTNGLPQDSSFIISEFPGIIEVANSSIIMNDCSEFTVAYIATLGDSFRNVYHRSFASTGQPLTASQMISQAPAGDLIDMAINSDGKYLAEWEAVIGDQNRITAQRFQSDGELIGDNFQILSPADSMNQYAPSVILHNNNIYTAWHEQDNDTSRVWFNIIDFNNPPAGISGEQGGFPTQFSLRQNYPNPFNSTTTIQYDLPYQTDVIIVIYDLLGHAVETLVSGIQDAGQKSIIWDSSQVASGIYFYRLSTNQTQLTRKLIVLK